MTKSYTVSTHDLGDFTYARKVDATSITEAKAKVEKAYPGEFAYHAELTKMSKSYEVTGLVNNVRVSQKLCVSALSNEALVADATKFFKKLQGAYKRTNKKTVEVLSVVEIA